MSQRGKISNANDILPEYEPVSAAGRRLQEKLKGAKNENPTTSQAEQFDAKHDRYVKANEKWVPLLEARQRDLLSINNGDLPQSKADEEIASRFRIIEAIKVEMARRVAQKYPHIRREISSKGGISRDGTISKHRFNYYARENIATLGFSYQVKEFGMDLICELFADAAIAHDAALQELCFSPDTVPENGIDFEYWVADNLNRLGWNAITTKSSGDQGIDVIATRNGVELGIQCKLYTGNVGNSAVQQAFSGKNFYKLSMAAVVTTGSFTRSAKALAEETGVLLLTHYELPNLHEILESNLPLECRGENPPKSNPA